MSTANSIIIEKSKMKLKRAKVREQEFSTHSRDTGKDVFQEEVRLFVQKRGGLVEEGDEPAAQQKIHFTFQNVTNFMCFVN